LLARGGWLLLVSMFGLMVYDLSRPALQFEERPAFSISAQAGALVLVRGTGTDLDGIHQINDASQLVDVIKLANLRLSAAAGRKLRLAGPIVSGKLVELQVVKGQVQDIDCGWMPAAMRIALGIPLRVEQMTAADWQDLPGVGPALALRIEEERQHNGEFDHLSDLTRVDGVGLKSILNWETFFLHKK
jgi:competence protein ComEA